MKRLNSIRIVFLTFVLSSCTFSSTPIVDFPTTTPSLISPTSTLAPTPTASPEPTMTLEPIPFVLATPGPYDTGIAHFSFVDSSRDNREVSIVIRYPAIVSEDQKGSDVKDAPPNLTDAPYPVILSSSKVAAIFGSHLASHGFITVGVRNIDTYEPWDWNLVDQPLDILFALDMIATQPLDGLEEIINSNRAGVMGYSFDGYNSLAMSGARIDPEFYLSQCAQADKVQPPLSEWRIWYFCDLSSKWDAFTARAGEELITSEDGLWQPMTDPRILAAMPMAPEGTWLFGERGLAAADRPTLIIGATLDGLCPYQTEAVYIFEHLNTPDRYMISFVGEGHMMIYDTEPVKRMTHFATAFFGYYLQGREEYALYFSEDFVSRYTDLAWGVYTEE